MSESIKTSYRIFPKVFQLLIVISVITKLHFRRTMTLPGDSLAIKITAFFMRCSGFWISNTPLQKRIMDGVVTYSIGALIFAFAVTINDLYHNYGDFNKFAFGALNFSIAGMGLLKVVVFAAQRETFLNLILSAKNNFWYDDYDDEGLSIMNHYTSKSAVIIILIAFMCHLTAFLYCIKPVIVNQGKNESERVLPFQVYINLPVSMTPWYEIIYAIEIFSAYHCGVCYFCFDNFLCQTNMTLVGQFLILEDKFRSICSQEKDLLLKDDYDVCLRFRNCVIRHQLLINFIDDMKELYKNVILGIVLVLSFLICLQTYQLMTATEELFSKIHSCAYVCNTVIQLYFFILTCNSVAEASIMISHAAYDVQWFFIKSTSFKNALVKDLSVVIMRSQKPCNMAVGGFSEVDLSTFTSICKASFSYLTLVRQTA